MTKQLTLQHPKLKSIPTHLQPRFARNRAKILKILCRHPGLTTLQIMEHERKYFGRDFFTGPRLRELRKLGYVRSDKGEDGLLHWSIIPLVIA